MPNEQKNNETGNNFNNPSNSKKKLEIRTSVPKVKIPKMSKKSGWRGFVIYAILGLILFAFFASTSSSDMRLAPTEPISKVISDVKDSKVEKIEIDGDKINVDLKANGSYVSRKEESQSFFETLKAAGVEPSGVQIGVKDRTLSQA